MKAIGLILIMALMLIACDKPVIEDRANYVSQSAVMKYHMLEISADTLTVTYVDNIVGVAVSVPTGATDTTFVSGSTTTFKGIATTHYAVAPGEYISIGLGDLNRIDSLVIIAQAEARVILTPIKY